jgi:hypothetical protein
MMSVEELDGHLRIHDKFAVKILCMLVLYLTMNLIKYSRLDCYYAAESEAKVIEG